MSGEGVQKVMALGVEVDSSGNSLQFAPLIVGSTVDYTILESAARTASVDSADFVNVAGKGGHFIVDITSITLTPQITVSIQGKDPVSSEYYDILVSNPLSVVGTFKLTVFPGILDVAALKVADIIPRVFRVSVSNVDADSITYSIGASLVL